MKKLIFLTIFFVLVASVISKADRRYFARSNTSYTLPAKAFELEIWNTGKLGKDAGYFYRWQPRIEFEYGLTDKLTTSIYFNFYENRSKNNLHSSKSFSFTTTSLEVRYRLFEIGEYIVDPTIYGEIYFGGDKVKYEPKLFLTKRFKNIISVVNINSEFERDIPKNETESDFEIIGGLAYEINPNVAAGVEFRQHFNFEDIFKDKKNQALFIGPTLNFQTEKFYFTINILARVL